MKRNNSSQSGVALLMALGILAVMSILGVAFSTNMRLMERTTRDFVYDAQARYLTEGGIEYAIAQLKEDARNDFVFDGIGVDDKLNLSAIEFPQDIVGSVEIKVIDTARQININNASEPLLRCIPGIEDMASAIISQRNQMPNNRFLTKQSVALAGKIDFDAIKDYITTDTYIDENVLDKDGNSQKRSAININTLFNQAESGDENAERMLKNILKVVSGIGDSKASNILSSLRNPPAPYSLPVESWTEFFDIVYSAGGIGGTLANRINEMFNPNRKKPSSTYATEFCFHSGGTYEITATGAIAKNTQTLARKTVTATVKIFDLWNQTKRTQFIGEDLDYDGVLDPEEDTNGNGILEPQYERVTWLDSCPVKSSDNWILDPNPDPNYSSATSYFTIPDSLKLGYWDDFSDSAYSLAQWKAFAGQRVVTSGDEGILGGYGRTSLCIYRSGGQPRVDLYDEDNKDKWKFQRQYIQAYLNDNHTNEWLAPPAPQWLAWMHSASSRLSFKGNPGTVTDSTVLHTANHNNAFYGYLPAAFELWIRPVGDPRDNTFKNEAIRNHPVRSKWNTIFKVWSLESSNHAEETYIMGGSPPRYLSADMVMPTQYPLPGVVRVFSPYNDFWQRSFWDNIRVIPAVDSDDSKYGKGIYKSVEFRAENYPVDWGTIYSTVTTPGIADSGNVTVSLQTSADNFVTTIIPPAGRIAGSNSNSIRYLAILQTAGVISGPYKPFETPVLEDVWITYLPKTKVLYWKEGIAESSE